MSNQQQESYKNCLNCGTELNGPYCHECGQHVSSTNANTTVGGFIIEYINNAYNWDSQFFKTIWNLISKPGQLTNEFLSGKFVSQEHPLKLNMFLLFIMITLFAIFSSAEKINNSVQSITTDEQVVIGLQVDMLMRNQEQLKALQESPRDTVQLLAPLFLAESYPTIFINLHTIEDNQGQNIDKWTAIIPKKLIEDKIIVPDANGNYQFNPESQVGKKEINLINDIWSKMVDLTNNYFPILVLFTAPFLSLALSFVERKKRLPHINHFIFALHYIALLEVLMIFIFVLNLTIAPAMEIMEWIMTISSCAYLAIAYRTVYKTSNWFKAMIKALFTSFVYFFICLLIFIGIFLVACFFVADKI